MTIAAAPEQFREASGPVLANLALRDPDDRALRHIPARRGLPFVGAMPEILLDPMAFSERMVRRHGCVYRFRAMGRWHVHVAGAQAAETVLFDPGGGFSAAEGWGPLVSPLLPAALLVRDGAEHRAARRRLGEAFRHPALLGYRPLFQESIDAAVQSWTGRAIDLFAETRRLSFDIAASTFMGLSFGGERRAALACLSQILAGLLATSYNPWASPARARALSAKRRLETLLASLVERKSREPGDDFLARICAVREEDDRPLPAEEIVDLFVFLLVAAQDTMSSALASSVHFLAAEPEWRDRLAAELKGEGVDRPVEAAGAALPLMEMFFKEAIRLNPPAPVVWRRALRDTEVNGAAIPAGTMTGVNIMVSHRLEPEWPEPERFDPFRFLPEREQARHRFAFLPFGAGVHKCLGLHFAQQQAKVLMARLLLDCALAPAGPARRWYAWPSARPLGALRVSVERRPPGS